MRVATSALSGATQQPLLDASQLVPGAIITGASFSHVWEVISCQGVDVELRKLLAVQPSPCAGDHALVRVGSSSLAVCRCGYAIERVAGLLPLRADTARAVVLVPSGPVVVPDRYTIYVALDGTRQSMISAGQWTRELPILPKLCALWTVPQELRGMLAGSRDTLADPTPGPL